MSNAKCQKFSKQLTFDVLSKAGIKWLYSITKWLYTIWLY